MQSNPTPGPWTICYDGQLDGPNGETICLFTWDSFKEFSEPTNSANARLLAAAPDLLAALIDLVERGTDSPEHVAAERAIARATGESA